MTIKGEIPLAQTFTDAKGIKRILHFHDDKWIAFVLSAPSGRAMAFENAGRWAMLDEPKRFENEA